jgi:dimethylargininase
MFTRAIARKPGPDFAQGITRADLGAPDFQRLLGQHTAYLLLTRTFMDRPEFGRFQRLLVAPEEEYAANTLWINGHLIVPAGFPRTRAQLERLGLPVHELDTSEARKMDGALTCLSLRF